MAFREVPVFEIREVLRLWLGGEGVRSIARLAQLDRKTVRRFVAAAEAAGVVRGGDVDQLSDGLIGVVCAAVRPARPGGHGVAWELLVPHEELIGGWVGKGLRLTKIADLLARRGVVVPYRTLHRFAVERCGFGHRGITVRVADGEPGVECQVDFGRMGLLFDPVAGRRRVLWALIFTACFSRHCFVWLTFRQRLVDVIDGFEAAWLFFGGVFRVVIPDCVKTIVVEADDVNPRFNEGFVEYAQSRGFVVDPARVRHPRDKPRVERMVSYVRGSFFAGEDFVDLADAQRRAEQWCRSTAGLRLHGTTQRRPTEVFAAEEAPLLLPAPELPYDLPIYAHPKVHRDHHIEVAKALYSVPGQLIGHHVEARADAQLVKIFWRGGLIKVHPRQRPGGRSTDPADLPAGRDVYALRDIASLTRQAGLVGPSVGEYARRLLAVELPWTRMRQVYRLLGLARRFGDDRVDAACAQALAVDVVDVGLIARLLERGREHAQLQPPPLPVAQTLPLRFARHPDHTVRDGSNHPHSCIDRTPSRASMGLTAAGFRNDPQGESR
jgi:transposase